MKRQITIKQQVFLKYFVKNLALLMVPILLIGPYSIYQLNKESRDSLRRNNYNVLYQLEGMMNSLFSELDNVYYYLKSNPSVATGIKTAYNENSLSLNSIRNSQNYCSILRYYINSNEYIENIYVYYFNDNDRLLVPQSGMVSIQSYKDLDWMNYMDNSEADLWMETGRIVKDEYSEPVPAIFYFRKLYSSVDPTSAIGVVVMEYNVTKLRSYADSLGLYENQLLTIIESGENILFQNIDGSVTLSDVDFSLSAGEYSDYSVGSSRDGYTISVLQSVYWQDISFVSIIPSRYLYAASSQLSKTMGLLIGAAIFLSVIMAAVRSRNDYHRLEEILILLSDPEKATQNKINENALFKDPYNYIMYNIINLFLQQDYLKAQNLEKNYKLQTMEMFALQQQINPHFLHNTLNLIYWDAISLTGEPNQCSEMIVKLSSIMRYSLSNPGEEVSLREEISYLQDYIYIQLHRHNHKFQVEFSTGESELDVPIKKMLLQPLVENAITHGIGKKNDDGNLMIRIKIHQCQDYIYISVLDNGVGIEREKLAELKKCLENTEAKGTHVGLYNCHRRLILGYGSNAGLHICSHVNIGTCVYFRLPIVK